MAKTDQAVPAYHLVVVIPFGDYQRGDRITDAAKIAEIIASENANNCNTVTAA